jgi:hypothetical protein
MTLKNQSWFWMKLKKGNMSAAKQSGWTPWEVRLADFGNKNLSTPQGQGEEILLNLRSLRSRLREPLNGFMDKEISFV